MRADFNNPFTAAFRNELQKKIRHLTTYMLPHYLVKCECSTIQLFRIITFYSKVTQNHLYTVNIYRDVMFSIICLCRLIYRVGFLPAVQTSGLNRQKVVNLKAITIAWYEDCRCYYYSCKSYQSPVISNKRKMLNSITATCKNKKAQLSLTNPRDACKKFARFTYEQWGCKLYS